MKRKKRGKSLLRTKKRGNQLEIGRASCRERVLSLVWGSGVGLAYQIYYADVLR